MSHRPHSARLFGCLRAWWRQPIQRITGPLWPAAHTQHTWWDKQISLTVLWTKAASVTCAAIFFQSSSKGSHCFNASPFAFSSALMIDQCTGGQWINFTNFLDKVWTCQYTNYANYDHSFVDSSTKYCVIELIPTVRHGRTILHFLLSEVNYPANSDVS